MSKPVVDIPGLLALNEDFRVALWNGERWALRHLADCESLNRGEHEGYRRRFDGIPRKWCGVSCTSEEGCVTCVLPEDHAFAKEHQRYKESNPQHLASQGVIKLHGKVGSSMEGSVTKMIQISLEEGLSEVTFDIASIGGDSATAFRIYEAIKNAPFENRIGLVTGYAFSAAAIILQACDERIAQKGTRILIHDCRYGEITGKMLRDPTVVKSLLCGADNSDHKANQIMVERSGRTLQEIQDLNDLERRLTPQEAKDFGLIDTIAP